MGTATAIVKQVYEAFGRGDVPAILNLVAGEVDWELVGPTNLPYAGRRKNHKEVADFFAAVAQTDDYMPSSRANLSRPTSICGQTRLIFAKDPKSMGSDLNGTRKSLAPT